jgi:hypothetical protein
MNRNHVLYYRSHVSLPPFLSSSLQKCIYVLYTFTKAICQDDKILYSMYVHVLVLHVPVQPARICNPTKLPTIP